MREKNAIIVPGLISNDEAAVIGETPYSDVTVVSEVSVLIFW